MQDWTSNPRAVMQYDHLMAKPDPREARDIALGLLSMNPPKVFEDAIESAIADLDDELDEIITVEYLRICNE